MLLEDASVNLRQVSTTAVPIGGVGAGYLEPHRDGLLHNVAINNNRTPDSEIAVADGAFLAIRAASTHGTTSRILQTRSSVRFQKAGISAPYLKQHEINYESLYPMATYGLKRSGSGASDAERFPLETHWTYYTPIIPFDTQASTLPALMITMSIRNSSCVRQAVSAMYTWENLRGCQRDSFRQARGPIEVVNITSDGDLPPESSARRKSDLWTMPAGLSFAANEECVSNQDGNYTLMAVPTSRRTVTQLQENQLAITFASWNKSDPEQVEEIWSSFHSHGELPNTLDAGAEVHNGSVCIRRDLEPEETARIVFVLTWHFPVYEVEGRDQGNGYTSEYSSSRESAIFAMKHHRYLLVGTRDWRDRLISSSLPPWFSRMLINNCYVFSTNTLLTRDGDFAMTESKDHAAAGPLDRMFYSSFGTLLFFPDLAEKELSLFAEIDESGTRNISFDHFSLDEKPAFERPGRLYRNLGMGCLHKPGHGSDHVEMVDLNSKFILMAYRNFLMTGKLVALNNLFPQLKAAINYSLEMDRDGDGVPDAEGRAITFKADPVYGMSSYAAGLWIVALRAFADICTRLQKFDEAEPFTRKASLAWKHFEGRLWKVLKSGVSSVNDMGYYKFYVEPKAGDGEEHIKSNLCHIGQLVGPWLSEFLAMEDGFTNRRVRNALRTLHHLNRRAEGFANACLPALRESNSALNDGPSEPLPGAEWWPNIMPVLLGCTQLYYGKPGPGLETVRRTHQLIHVTSKSIFDQPLRWDLSVGKAIGRGSHRHSSSLALWHVLFAIQGFFLSVPDKRVRVAPNLPKGIDSLQAPIFTPVSMGMLEYRRERVDAVLTQHVRLSFDTPIHIQTIEMKIPDSVKTVEVRLRNDEVGHQTEVAVEKCEGWNLVRVNLQSPIRVQKDLQIRLKHIAPLPEGASRGDA